MILNTALLMSRPEPIYFINNALYALLFSLLKQVEIKSTEMDFEDPDSEKINISSFISQTFLVWYCYATRQAMQE